MQCFLGNFLNALDTETNLTQYDNQSLKILKQETP